MSDCIARVSLPEWDSPRGKFPPLSQMFDVDDAGCWLWRGYVTPSGYGRLTISGVGCQAHRVVYTVLVGPVDEGLHLDHLCRVPRCVNPAHLEPVQPRVNTLRGDTIPAKHAAKTHCPQGHPLVDGNLVPHDLKRGRRSCAICRRINHREGERRRRAARKERSNV